MSYPPDALVGRLLRREKYKNGNDMQAFTCRKWNRSDFNGRQKPVKSNTHSISRRLTENRKDLDRLCHPSAEKR
ncbi:hypothetical protein ACCS66_38915, partial [Rhizobium ruizarguesonis]